MDPFEELWGVQPQPGPLALSLASGARLPAGMRNNNPGNIKYVPGLNYPGLVGPSQNRDEGDPQMVFDTPQNGMNAASQLAMKKYSGGRRSANDLIAGNMGWTPGNTSAAANVARTMGIGPNDDLGLSDPGRMQSFLKALTLQEHGPASKLYGDDVYAGIGGGGTPAPANQEKPMPMPFEDDPQRLQQPQQPGPLANAMGGIFGSGDQPGYFGRLMADPQFMMGASVLGSGLAGKDAGTAMLQGAQAANATSDMAERRRRAQTWAKVMGGTSPDSASPLLKGIPPEALPIIQSMGPEEGMKMLHQFALSKMAPHKLGTAAPGSSVFDEQTGQVLSTVPSESPYAKEMGMAQAKADVKQGQSSVAGQQMLDLTDRMISLAGQPGSKERQTFSDATGPIQGTDWYQGIKGFVNSKAETPQVYRNLQQDLGTIKLLASRAYLSGEGQVSDNERRMIADAVGNVESAPSGEAAIQAMTNLKQIVTQVFMKPKAISGDPSAQPASPNGAPNMQQPMQGAAPANIVMPGMAMQGAPDGAPPQAPPQGAPPTQAAPQPQPQPGPQGGPPPGGPAPVTATGPNGEKVQLDPASGQWQPVQAPPAGGGEPAFSRSASPLWARGEDQAKLRANPSPELIQQYDAVFGPGSAAKVLMTPKSALGLGRGSYRMAP